MRLMKSESANNAFLEPSNCTKYSRAWSRAALRINEGQRGSSFFFSTALISMESKEARASGATVPTPKEQAELECVCVPAIWTLRHSKEELEMLVCIPRNTCFNEAGIWKCFLHQESVLIKFLNSPWILLTLSIRKWLPGILGEVTSWLLLLPVALALADKWLSAPPSGPPARS